MFPFLIPNADTSLETLQTVLSVAQGRLPIALSFVLADTLVPTLEMVDKHHSLGQLRIKETHKKESNLKRKYTP
jgi:hypothetical protein